MLEEFYLTIGGSYVDIKKRFMTDERILRFVNKFPLDGSFALLQSSIESGNVQDAFRAAHTLKGVAQNLGFNRLYEMAEEVTEVLRGGSLEVGSMMPALTAQYELTISEIAKLNA